MIEGTWAIETDKDKIFLNIVATFEIYRLHNSADIYSVPRHPANSENTKPEVDYLVWTGQDEERGSSDITLVL